jgi:hypothetical protein
MNAGEERLEAVEERIEEAKVAADRVEEGEGLGMHHRDADRHGAFEPSGDDGSAGENPSEGADRDVPGEADERPAEPGTAGMA